MQKPLVVVRRSKRARNVLMIAKRTHAHHVGAKQCRAICEMYLELMKEAVFEGYEWSIPGWDAKFCICRRITGGASSINRATREEKYNVIRLGEAYRFRFESDFFKKRQFKFIPTPDMLKRLNHILYNTNTQYRLEN